MGKKTPLSTNKNKEKRLARKIEQRRIADGMSLVTSANQRQDLMTLCKEMLIFRHSGLEADLYIQRVTELEKNSLDWVIDLTVRNMQTLYETCAWGWNKVRKVEEMTDDSAWYLIATETNGTPVAFSHFRFDMDHGDAVLYCYELQVEAAGRRRGLGQHLLRVLERLARATRMSCVRLTALTHNSGAAAFFRACGYKLDETSPPEEDAQHYEILSKPTTDSDPIDAETDSKESTEKCPLASGMQPVRVCVTNTK